MSWEDPWDELYRILSEGIDVNSDMGDDENDWDELEMEIRHRNSDRNTDRSEEQTQGDDTTASPHHQIEIQITDANGDNVDVSEMRVIDWGSAWHQTVTAPERRLPSPQSQQQPVARSTETPSGVDPRLVLLNIFKEEQRKYQADSDDPRFLLKNAIKEEERKYEEARPGIREKQREMVTAFLEKAVKTETKIRREKFADSWKAEENGPEEPIFPRKPETPMGAQSKQSTSCGDGSSTSQPVGGASVPNNAFGGAKRKNRKL